MERFADKVQKAAYAWREYGKTPELLLTGVTAALADLWAYPRQQRGDPALTDELTAFISASKAKTDISAVWRECRNCESCGERYKLENMAICVECGETLRRRCASRCVSGQEVGISYSCQTCGGEMY